MSYSVPDAPVLLAPIFLDLNQHPQRGPRVLQIKVRTTLYVIDRCG